MPECSTTAWERAMKVQEGILRAMAKELTWWQAAEIIGISDRSMRRWKQRYEEHGYDNLLDLSVRKLNANMGQSAQIEREP
jgi:transposase